MMMSEAEETSVLDLESIALEAVKKKSLQKNLPSPNPPPVAATSIIVNEPVNVPEVVETAPQEPEIAPKPRITTASKHARTIDRKITAERRTVEKNLHDLAKKKDQDMVRLMEQAMKNHCAQIDKERSDYLAVMHELKEAITNQTTQFAESCQNAATDAAEGEVERMIAWFHDEFMKELDRKSREYEDLRTASEKQANKMLEENEGKSKRIMILDDKIKELAGSLPPDIRRELSKELGIEISDNKAPAETAKKQKAGLFTKLAAIFRQKSKPKPAPMNKKHKKTSSKQRAPQDVIAS